MSGLVAIGVRVHGSVMDMRVRVERSQVQRGESPRWASLQLLDKFAARAPAFDQRGILQQRGERNVQLDAFAAET